MKRTQAIFMAVALCLALLVSGTAFAAVTVPGPFKNTTNNTDVTFGQYDSLVKQVDFLSSTDAIPTLVVSHDRIYVSYDHAGALDVTSTDFIFIRATQTNQEAGKKQLFNISADYNNWGMVSVDKVSLDLQLAGSTYTEFDWGTKGVRHIMVTSADSVSEDIPLRWLVCCPTECDQIYKNKLIVEVWSADQGADPAGIITTVSADIYVYIPCEGYDKRWQFLPTTEDPYLTYAHKDDMVIFDKAIGTTGHAALKHTLDLGPFVVEMDKTATFQRDWVVESLYNKFPYYAAAVDGTVEPLGTNSHDWLVVAEFPSFTATSYKQRFMYQFDTLLAPFDPNILVDEPAAPIATWNGDGDVVQYLALNDRPAFTIDGANPKDLAPGMSMYFGLPALSFDNHPRYMVYANFNYEWKELVERFCQTTVMDPQIWIETECIDFTNTDDPCAGAGKIFKLHGMTFESAVKAKVAEAMGLAVSDLFDVCVEACEPTTTLDCNLLRVIPNPPAADTVVFKAANFTITPKSDSVPEGKELISPLRVAVYFKRSEIALKAASVATALDDAFATVPDVNRGPVDALFDVLTLGKQIDKDDAASWKNLKTIAVNAGTPMGLKNFFRFWPSSGKDMSVKDAWAADEEMELAFYVVFADGVPADGEYVKALDGYFVIYDGVADKIITDPLALMTPWSTITPTPAEGVAYKGLVEPFTQEALSDEEKAAAEEKLPEGKVCSSTLGADTVAGDLADGGTSAVVEVTAYSSYSVIAMKTDGTWEALALPTASDFALAAVDEYEIADGGDYDLSDEAGKVEFKVAVCKLADAPTPTTGGGGGGGGCNAGFAPLALLLLAPLAVLLKK
ncbi:Synerg-CTERM sorting domain-containing protein [Aminiphilus sp.]|uniref:Synerg-CTERM sorting domain-containing protein n=1 Tax=Aminiphilus sp. TaxID=1872488 RepID=UPI002620785F|nr:Synerg-CTERM sorting domain-containing protein [Aminiphilus sp.]